MLKTHQIYWSSCKVGQVPCEFWADWPRFSFLGEAKLRDSSSLALLWMVPHQWPVALAVIWHIYSCLACSLEDSAKDLPSSGKVVLGQGQVSCELSSRLAQVKFSGEFEPRGWAAQLPQIHESGAQSAAPDVIWHIYLHLCCSSKDGGRDLPSSGEAACYHGERFPVSFGQIGLGSIFAGEELRQGCFQPCPAQDGALSMSGSSRCDLAHLLTPLLLLKG